MNRIFFLSLIAVVAMSFCREARAGWGAADKESVTAEDFRRLSRLSGNDKKNWKPIVGLMDETRENERRIEELARRRREAAARPHAERPPGAFQELSGSAGPRAAGEVPALPAAGPLAAKKKGKADEEERL